MTAPEYTTWHRPVCKHITLITHDDMKSELLEWAIQRLRSIGEVPLLFVLGARPVPSVAVYAAQTIPIGAKGFNRSRPLILSNHCST